MAAARGAAAASQEPRASASPSFAGLGISESHIACAQPVRRAQSTELDTQEMESQGDRYLELCQTCEDAVGEILESIVESEGVLAHERVTIRGWFVMYPRASIVFKQKKGFMTEIVQELE